MKCQTLFTMNNNNNNNNNNKYINIKQGRLLRLLGVLRVHDQSKYTVFTLSIRTPITPYHTCQKQQQRQENNNNKNRTSLIKLSVDASND